MPAGVNSTAAIDWPNLATPTAEGRSRRAARGAGLDPGAEVLRDEHDRHAGRNHPEEQFDRERPTQTRTHLSNVAGVVIGETPVRNQAKAGEV